ncbi:hypothetical protein NHX12_002665, partial [Muraenolepis orangiensis]
MCLLVCPAAGVRLPRCRVRLPAAVFVCPAAGVRLPRCRCSSAPLPVFVCPAA